MNHNKKNKTREIFGDILSNGAFFMGVGDGPITEERKGKMGNMKDTGHRASRLREKAARKKKREEFQERKVPFFSKMSTKIGFLVAAMVIIPVLIVMLISLTESKNALEDTYETYTANLAEEAAVGIDFATEFGESTYKNFAYNLAQEVSKNVDTSINNAVDTYLSYVANLAESAAANINSNIDACEEIYQTYAQNLAEEAIVGIDLVSGFGLELNMDRMTKILGQLKMKDVEGSYAYLVAPDGTMLWHPTVSKIGQPVENAAVRGIVERLANGESVPNGSVIYDYNGARKLAGYAFTAQGYILIITADVDAFVKIDYDGLLGGIEISGVEGSYAYMVSQDGTMLWHPTASKIGQPVENAAVNGIVEKLAKGENVENGSILYEYKGSNKIAGYAFADNGNIIIVTADYDKFVKIDYDALLRNVEISGVEGSYAYMVEPDGTMLWHPTASKIGQPVENAAVTSIVGRLKNGENVEDGSILYEYKGAMKVAGYALTADSDIVVVTADYDKFMKFDYDSLIGNIEITNVPGSYAYMVDQEGTIVYASGSAGVTEGGIADGELMDAIRAATDASGETASGTATYVTGNTTKLAGYAPTSTGNIIVVVGDRDVFLSSITSLTTSLILISLICMIIATLFGVIIVRGMTGALDKILPIINNTARFDLRHHENSDALLTRRDEIGVMAYAVGQMRSSLRKMVGEIDEASDTIADNVDELQEITLKVNRMCSDNSAITEELAAGMEEASASTQSIAQNIEVVHGNAKNIEDLANTGAETSAEVMKRADDLKKTTEEATRKTIEIYESVKLKSEAAISASEAVGRINELTETIMAISSQTRLLSLNASIEAARAGESGRGFSVVASEIGNLATQTSTAVTDITNIVAKVNEAVEKLSTCVTETVSFLEKNVLRDYDGFGKVSEQYRADADEFRISMAGIKESIVALTNTIGSIVGASDGINATVNGAAGGVTDIAGKTSDMVYETSGSSVKVDECRKSVAELDDIISRFTLE